MGKNLIEHLHCIVCNHDELIPLDRYEKAHLVQCLNCNLVFSDKQPSQEEIDRIQRKEKWKDHITPEAIKRYNHVLDRFEHFRKTNRLLDLDCSHGEFLEMARERGWKVYGTADTSESLSLCRSKGLDICEGSFNFSDFDEDTFDIVCVRSVLEHVTNPNEILQKIRSVLRTGGLVYATTPNYNSILRIRLREKYSLISFPFRLVYYSRKPFKRLFRNNQFKVMETEVTGVSYSKKKLASAKKRVPLTEESDFLEWEFDENDGFVTRFMKRNLNPFVCFFGLGDFLKGWFIKQ
jgi:2-polyprenyl-3-methyl-5-hydroxy-6-metoxy-1,4-benzoquinol methylase